MARSGDEGIEQRLDRWVEAGRQFVDGVSGARPGSRGSARGSLRRSGSRLNPGELGRWVENKLEWLLDDEGEDDWREPWQQQRPSAAREVAPSSPQRSRGSRRRLEAISRRGTAAAPSDTGDWPSDDELRIARWQRDGRSRAPAAEPPTYSSAETNAAPPPARPLPRSTRRR